MKNNLLLLACLSAGLGLTGCDSAVLLDANLDNSTSDGNNSTDGGNSANGGDADGNGTNGNGDGTGGNGDGNTADSVIRSVGLIKLEPLGVTTDSTRGLFGELPETRTAQQIRDWYIPPTDACVVTNLADEAPAVDFQVFDQAATLVSAGESLVLTDDNGTYATLVRSSEQTSPAYTPEAEINQAPAPNLSVDIPGDQFATFTSIPVSTVPALQLTSPAVGGNVGTTTTFEWPANNVPGSVVEIFTSGISSASNEAIFIGCSLVDDGSFTFPEGVQALMGTGYDDDWTTLLRIAYNVIEQDDTLVFVANSVKAN